MKRKARFVFEDLDDGLVLSKAKDIQASNYEEWFSQMELLQNSVTETEELNELQIMTAFYSCLENRIEERRQAVEERKKNKIKRDIRVHFVNSVQNDPENFRRHTRFTIPEFEYIAQELDRCFEFKQTRFDTRSKLFLFLSRMSGGDRMKRGVSDCGMSASTISNYFREIQSKMAKLFSHVIAAVVSCLRMKD